MTVHFGRTAVFTVWSICLQAVRANLNAFLRTSFPPGDQLRIFPSTPSLLPESFRQRLVCSPAEQVRAPQDAQFTGFEQCRQMGGQPLIGAVAWKQGQGVELTEDVLIFQEDLAISRGGLAAATGKDFGHAGRAIKAGGVYQANGRKVFG